MGSEMDAALGAYSNIGFVVPLFFMLGWLSVGLLVAKFEDDEDGR